MDKANTTSTQGTGSIDWNRHTSTDGTQMTEEVNVDREAYEKDLRERQRKHLESIKSAWNKTFKPCLHDSCSECLGTGRKKDGSFCAHMIACNCPKCSPHSL